MYKIKNHHWRNREQTFSTIIEINHRCHSSVLILTIVHTTHLTLDMYSRHKSQSVLIINSCINMFLNLYFHRQTDINIALGGRLSDLPETMVSLPITTHRSISRSWVGVTKPMINTRSLISVFAFNHRNIY